MKLQTCVRLVDSFLQGSEWEPLGQSTSQSLIKPVPKRAYCVITSFTNIKRICTIEAHRYEVIKLVFSFIHVSDL